MNQLEDDLHRVLQLARTQSRLDRQLRTRSSTTTTKRLHNSSSSLQSRESAVTRHRHARTAHQPSKAPSTLLHAKLRGISALYGLENTTLKLSDCSSKRLKSAHRKTKPDSNFQPSHDDQEEEDQEQAILEAKLAARRELYKRHYSGLQGSYGPSGLPKLECLLDAAQQAKTKMARHSPLAIGASVLTSGNRIYASCTIESLHDAKYSICAERAALLKILGEDPGHVVTAMAISSDQQTLGVLPSPCGSCREFMAEFGDFPVFLVNDSGDYEETRSFELFPRARQLSTAKVQAQQSQSKSHQGDQISGCNGSLTKPKQSGGDHNEDDTSLDKLPVNVRDWTVQHVLRWLVETVEMPQYTDIFQRSGIDGCTLLHLEDSDLQLLLGILQPLHRRRLLLHIDRLKDRELLEHGIDYGQLQDYLAVLDRDRIAIVAALKATFDRLDQNKDGFLDFREVRQALSAMQCDASPQAVEALLRGKLLSGDGSNLEGKVAFVDFAAAFSSLAMQPTAEAANVHITEMQWELPVVDFNGLRGTFEKADRNKSGSIDEQELIALFKALQKDTEKEKDNKTIEKAREWFTAADFDGDGRLSFAEFLVRYVQLTGLDISKLKLFFEGCAPLDSTRLKPVGVLKRALEMFFPAFTSSEISVWYKRYLNSNLLRNVHIADEMDNKCPPVGDTEPTETSATKPAATAARTSLTISYADFVLAVFLFQDHTKDRRQQLRELTGKLSNDALVHKSRIVHLQQTGHVRMCPQTMDTAAAAAESQSLAKIRRAQQQKRRAHQKSSDSDDDEAKCGSDDDNVATAARNQKRRLARQLARVDATFDRFARAKATKKEQRFSPTRERENKASDSDSSDAQKKTRNNKCELNAMETAQAMTELGIACPRDQMLRLLKEECFGIHDCVDRRDFRRLVQHFHTRSESTLGSFPAHRRPVSVSIWDEDAEHAKKMAHMAALLSGEYGKHRNREDYDQYLRLGSVDRKETKAKTKPSSEAMKPWKKEMVRFHTEKEVQKHRTRDDASSSKRDRRERVARRDREEAKGDSSSSEVISRSSGDSRPHRNTKRQVSRSRSRSHRRRSTNRSDRSKRRQSHSSASSFSSTETTESEREELHHHHHHQSKGKSQRGFEIGDRVFSRGGDGRGTLIRLYRDYFVADVHFDNGKKAKNVDLAKLRRLDPLDEDDTGRKSHQPKMVLRVGTHVAVSHKGTKTTRKGKITLCRLNGTFDVLVDELGEHETLKRVQAKHLRVVGKPVVYTKGVSVKLKQRHEYLRGKVTVCRVDGTYDVQLRRTDKSVLKRVDVDLLSPDDDDEEEDSSDEGKEDIIRKMSTQKRRSANDSDDNEEKNNDKYDDFEPEFAKGERVEARFQGNETFYPGKIARVLSDGTFDVRYDDGDEEIRVKSHFIRAIKASSGGGSKANNSTNQTRAKDQDDYGDDGFESS